MTERTPVKEREYQFVLKVIKYLDTLGWPEVGEVYNAITEARIVTSEKIYVAFSWEYYGWAGFPDREKPFTLTAHITSPRRTDLIWDKRMASDGRGDCSVWAATKICEYAMELKHATTGRRAILPTRISASDYILTPTSVLPYG